MKMKMKMNHCVQFHGLLYTENEPLRTNSWFIYNEYEPLHQIHGLYNYNEYEPLRTMSWFIIY